MILYKNVCKVLIFTIIRPIISTINSFAFLSTISSILNCRKEWIDLDKGYLYVLESKNGKSREIPISDVLKPILEEAMNNNSDYVFVNPETQLPYVDIKHSFTSVLEHANINNFFFTV